MDKVELESAMVAHRLLTKAAKSFEQHMGNLGHGYVSGARRVLGLDDALSFACEQAKAVECLGEERHGFSCEARQGLVQEILNGLGAQIVEAQGAGDSIATTSHTGGEGEV